MARQGVSRPKVVSSGRLTGSGRGQIHKKKVAGSHVPPLEAAYSLYSTDSEDQLSSDEINNPHPTETKPKPQGMKTCTFKSKSKNLSRKFETDKKKHGKKTSTAIHAIKKQAAVQKMNPSARCHLSSDHQSHGIKRSQDQPSVLTAVTQAEHVQQSSLPLAYSQPAACCNLPSLGQVHTSTLFNCRLTTSTPALSPQRPGSAHSEPCTSKSLQSSGSSSGELHQLRATSADTPSCSHGTVEMSGTPNQYATTFSMPPAAQRQSPVTVPPVEEGSCTPVGHGGPVISSPGCIVPQVGSVGPGVPVASSNESLTCSSSAVLQTQPCISQPQPDSNELILMIGNGQEQESLEEGVSSAEVEEEKEGIDTTPVRDISCQTSNEKLTVLSHKAKPTSPEKTAQKVTTVRCLLGELKALVANQDSDAVRLISEVEQSISLLPLMVGSTNIQAEIALALQPLRSENAQLRRRLRILNQQLLERERAERRARPEACDMEVVALQSLNLTLQTQLNESHRELNDLQQENVRLRKAVEDKDSELKHHNDLCELENSRLRLEVSEALAELQISHSKLKEYEIEKTALSSSLQQREADVSRLQEVIRNFQRSQTKDPSIYFPQTDLCQPNSQLTKSVLELHENAERKTTVSDKLSNSVKTYLQTLEDIGPASAPNQVHCRSQTLQRQHHNSLGQINGVKENFMPSVENRDNSKPNLETIAENVAQLEEQKRKMFAPLRETPVELMTVKNQRADVDAHVGLKYIGRAFENLGISDGLHIQDVTKDSRDYLSDRHCVALHLNQKNNSPNNQLVQSQHACRQLKMGVQAAYTGRPSAMENTLSSCDIKSLASEWSINSWSTFNTQDEQNFRDGLAALDASIESLQKTLKVDLNK